MKEQVLFIKAKFAVEDLNGTTQAEQVVRFLVKKQGWKKVVDHLIDSLQGEIDSTPAEYATYLEMRRDQLMQDEYYIELCAQEYVDKAEQARDEMAVNAQYY